MKLCIKMHPGKLRWSVYVSLTKLGVCIIPILVYLKDPDIPPTGPGPTIGQLALILEPNPTLPGYEMYSLYCRKKQNNLQAIIFYVIPMKYERFFFILKF